MALSQRTKDIMIVSMADKRAAQELALKIDTGFNASPAAHVANASSNSAITIALSTSDTYADAAVNSAVNGALTTVVTDMNAMVTKVNAILAALQAAGLMS